LEEVKVIKMMEPYERSKLADSFKEELFKLETISLRKVRKETLSI
jgi:hypothetical protein